MPINARLWFTLEGVTALLMHSPASMKSVPPGQLGVKEIPTVESEAAMSRYLLPDGNLYVPAIAVRNCLLSGAKGRRVTGTLRSATAALAGAIGMGEETFPLLDGAGNMLPGDHYTIDLRRVTLNRRISVLRARARIELPWGLRCNFPYNTNVVSMKLLEEVLNNAGDMVGLLDYRPERKGWLGKFKATRIWTGDL